MVALIFLALALRRIEFGVLAVAATPLFISFSLPTGTNAYMPVSLILSGLMVAIWFAWMLVRKQVSLVPTRANAPLLGFILISLLSLPWSWIFWRPEFFAWRATGSSGISFQIVQIGGLALLVMLPAMFLMAANVLRDPVWIKRLFLLMLLVGVPTMIENITSWAPSLQGFGLNAPGLFHLWLIALLYAQLLFNPMLNKWQRVAYGAIIGGWLFWAFILRIQNISFWLPVFVTLFVLTWLKSKRAALMTLAILVLPFIVSYEYYYQHVYVKAQVNDFNRFWLWPTVISIVAQYTSPLIGAGPVGYYPYFMTLYPADAMASHNNYVDVFGETGLIGLILFIWFLIAVLRSGFSLQQKLPGGFYQAFSIGMTGGLIGMMAAMMLTDWFMPFIYNNSLQGFDFNVYAWILLGAMAGMEHSLKSGQWVPTEGS